MVAVSQESEPHAADRNSVPGAPAVGRSTSISSALIWTGVVLFILGLLSIVVTFAVPVFDWRLSSSFYYLAMLAPAGMIVGVVGALASGRRVRSGPQR